MCDLKTNKRDNRFRSLCYTPDNDDGIIQSCRVSCPLSGATIFKAVPSRSENTWGNSARRSRIYDCKCFEAFDGTKTIPEKLIFPRFVLVKPEISVQL